MTSKDIKDLTPFLQGVFLAFRAWAKRVLNKDIVLVCTKRDVEDQQAAYAQGRTKPGPIVTNCDGVNKKSMHNFYPSRAFDFAFIVDKQTCWNEKWYDSCWLFFRDAKLTDKVRWGRNWTGKLKDRPHIEEV